MVQDTTFRPNVATVQDRIFHLIVVDAVNTHFIDKFSPIHYYLQSQPSAPLCGAAV